MFSVMSQIVQIVNSAHHRVSFATALRLHCCGTRAATVEGQAWMRASQPIYRSRWWLVAPTLLTETQPLCLTHSPPLSWAPAVSVPACLVFCSPTVHTSEDRGSNVAFRAWRPGAGLAGARGRACPEHGAAPTGELSQATTDTTARGTR